MPMEDQKFSATKTLPIRFPVLAKRWSAYAHARSITSICGSAAAWSGCRFRSLTFREPTLPAT